MVPNCGHMLLDPLLKRLSPCGAALPTPNLLRSPGHPPYPNFRSGSAEARYQAMNIWWLILSSDMNRLTLSISISILEALALEKLCNSLIRRPSVMKSRQTDRGCINAISNTVCRDFCSRLCACKQGAKETLDQCLRFLIADRSTAVKPSPWMVEKQGYQQVQSGATGYGASARSNK
ncbi:hypothetical protein M378DRAFT_161631 [Amanita muscaria Koide BX008]|uniref:Uncharacterized protein n=1 Tax=Amanita muscaria (strain Koide BX008) TaxID=946122 RepID=A0A0C2WW16_AMAMK|nr:hypothetical protein M378DRAFT_161631 [Amanita muscaria Koide BX008]